MNLSSRAIRGRVVLLVVVALVVCATLVGQASFVNRLKELLSSGVVVKAQVTSHRFGAGRLHPIIGVKFSYDGREIAQEREVSRAFYAQNADASSIVLTVAPDDPSNFETGVIDNKSVESSQVAFVSFLVVFLSIASVFGLCREVMIYNERRLLSGGGALTGSVVLSRVYRFGPAVTRIEYEYKTAGGHPKHAWSTMRGDVSALYPQGTHLVILCLPSHDECSKPLAAFKLVELDGSAHHAG